MSTIGKRPSGRDTPTAQETLRLTRVARRQSVPSVPSIASSDASESDKQEQSPQDSYATPPSSGRPSSGSHKSTSENIAATIDRWTQSASAASSEAAPSLPAIVRALEGLTVELRSAAATDTYDTLLHAVAKRGNDMPHVKEARAFLNENARARLAQFKEDLSAVSPQQARQSLETLTLLRKLDVGSSLGRDLRPLTANYTAKAGSTQLPQRASRTPKVYHDAYSWAVNAARAEVGGESSWKVLRAVQQDPNIAGVVVGAMGATIGRGTFAKVKPFVFADGAAPDGAGDSSARYVARITRTKVDQEKKNLRGKDYKGYAATTPSMARDEAEAIKAVGSELGAIMKYQDEKGRQIEVVRYFDRSLYDLGKDAPQLRTNGAFLHSVTMNLLNELEALDRARYVHLDIKPANVLFDYARMYAVFGDYGFARKQGFKNFYGGTHDYMSPEMQRGNLSQIDTRSDMYSLAFSIVDFAAKDLLRKTPLWQRMPEELYEDSEFVLAAAAAMTPQERLAHAEEKDELRQQWLLARKVVSYSSETASRALSEWAQMRFGSATAPLRIEAMQGHDSPFDRLFLQLARADMTTAQFVLTALSGNKEHRSTASRWLYRFGYSRRNLRPSDKRRMEETIAALQQGPRGARAQEGFAKLTKFLERIDAERATFSDSDPDSDPDEADPRLTSPQAARQDRGRGRR